MTPLQLFTALLLLVYKTSAFPNGAGGGCNITGMAAVAGSHLNSTNNRTVIEGTLYDGEINVTVGGIVLSNKTSTVLPINQDLVIAVQADKIPFKGVLVRLQAPAGVDTTGALVPQENTKIEATCVAPVVGITHTGSELKMNATGIVRFDRQVLNATFDITVVFINNDMGSAYTYTGFNVDFRNLSVTTIAPVAAAPTTNSSVAPQPTIAPRVAPVSPPTIQFTLSPSSAPTLTQGPTVTAFPTRSAAPSPSATPQARPIAVQPKKKKSPKHAEKQKSAKKQKHAKKQKQKDGKVKIGPKGVKVKMMRRNPYPGYYYAN